jgi:hypothetical protein
MKSQIVVTLSKDVLCEQLNDEVVLLDMSSGLYFGLTPVASKFWMALESGHTFEEAKQALLAEFRVSEERLSQDLEALVDVLEAKHLVGVQRLKKAA